MEYILYNSLRHRDLHDISIYKNVQTFDVERLNLLPGFRLFIMKPTKSTVRASIKSVTLICENSTGPEVSG